MEDQRLVWMGERLRLALGLRGGRFEELVERDGGKVRRDLQEHLDSPGGGYQPAMVFYEAEVEVEEEREVVEEQIIEQMVEQAEQLEGGRGSCQSRERCASVNRLSSHPESR